MTKTRASLILADVPLYGDKHRGDLIADADPDGRPVQHFRIRDQWPLDRMQASGAIDVDQYEAGRRFRDAAGTNELEEIGLAGLGLCMLVGVATGGGAGDGA